MINWLKIDFSQIKKLQAIYANCKNKLTEIEFVAQKKLYEEGKFDSVRTNPVKPWFVFHINTSDQTKAIISNVWAGFGQHTEELRETGEPWFWLSPIQIKEVRKMVK